MVTAEELSSIEGFDEDLAKELKNRAASYLKKIHDENLEILRSKGIDPYLIENKTLTQIQVLKLVEKEIKTRDDLADLSSDELIENLNNTNFDINLADKVILDAREHWFEKK